MIKEERASKAQKKGARTCLEREISNDKGGTCLKCSGSDKRKSAVSTVSRIR
jgi:hypothetical protein